MGHAVYHRTASGEAQLEDVSSLEAALELVERLRNEEGPTEVRLFKEVSVEVRTYYRVVAAEEGDSSDTPKAPEPAAEVVVDGAPAEEAVAEADDAPATASDDAADDEAVELDDVEVVAEDEVPVPSATSTRTEPPAGAMPLLSPPPSVTVHSGDHESEPAVAAASNDHRPKLFNRS